MSSLSILNHPLQAAPDRSPRRLVLDWNKDAPYSVRILKVPSADQATDVYKVEFACLHDAIRHCAHIVQMEELRIYEYTAAARREHARGYLRHDPRKPEAATVHAS